MRILSKLELAVRRPRWPARVWIALKAVLATLIFAAAFTLLNVTVNMRFPGPDDDWYLLPSLDITVVLIAFAIAGFAGKRPPVAAFWVLSALCLTARLLRIGDGIEARFYSRTFSLYMDLPLLPELVRLAYATISHHKFVCLAVAIVAGICVLFFLNYRCWVYLARMLERKLAARIFLGFTVLVACASVFIREPNTCGAFAPSIAPRLVQEGDFLLHGAKYRNGVLKEIERVDSGLLNNPNDFALLNHENVYLFFIESYGETLLELPLHRRLIFQTYKRFERMAASQGYQIASSLLDSPTYGGSSWLAHTTLGTAVFTNNQFRFRVVSDARPLTLTWFFKRAGYRTVLVQPATTRASPDADIYHFDQHYYAWNFDYAGPSFSWATMPDQYVLEFIHKKEIAPAYTPLFIEYALISSHAPWNNQPPIISDSSSIGDGRIYGQLRPVEFQTSWSDMSHASFAYARSIDYDFRVLSKYLTEQIHDSSVIIVLGDHQPNGDVTQHSKLHGVPIHVISRDRDVVERFIAQGFVSGMTQSPGQPRLAMDQFAPIFLRISSNKAVISNPPKQP